MLQLERLEDRSAPSGIANPEYTVLALKGADPEPTAALLRKSGGGAVVSEKELPFYFGDRPIMVQGAAKLALLLDHGLYHGTDTVVAVVLPPGAPGTGMSGGYTVTYRSVLHIAFGVMPYFVVPGTLTPQQAAPGIRYESATIRAGYFTTEPADPFQQPFPPGPDDQSELRQPQFALVDFLLLYLLSDQIG